MRTRIIASTAALAALATLGAAGSASAQHDANPSSKVESYTYTLNPVQASTVPGSQAWGTTRITALPNHKVQVQVEAWGVAPGVPHAMHLHGFTEAPDLGCPGSDADGGDGLVDVLDGVPFYGGILASLTTSGDTTAAHALDLHHFATADASGYLSYSRTFRNDLALANAGRAQVVVHGIDLNGNGVYDFEAGPSELTPDAPLEATLPVLCGGVAN
ncbi:hypothetical protein [Ornithinimicrobium tianjinense]|uniref:CHRD domain-containing protein n=1 Tax=Ornithinimicrobium tianjinense TaxID=1195761 RepID=A0A917BEW6_9MICO|nr:hypothetical protein [Ornithinimicrobium tianjinense]GGF39560.1 hypothetical protein GCM10011366_03950 [Ornithinimicrobium tianjinense]